MFSITVWFLPFVFFRMVEGVRIQTLAYISAHAPEDSLGATVNITHHCTVTQVHDHRHKMSLNITAC